MRGCFNKSPSPCLWFRVVTAGILLQALLVTLPTHTHTTWCHQQVTNPSFVTAEGCPATHQRSPFTPTPPLVLFLLWLLAPLSYFHCTRWCMRVCIRPGWPALGWRGSCFYPFWSSARELPCKHAHSLTYDCTNKRTHACWCSRASVTMPTRHCNCDHVLKNLQANVAMLRWQVCINDHNWDSSCSNIPLLLPKTQLDLEIFTVPTCFVQSLFASPTL